MKIKRPPFLFKRHRAPARDHFLKLTRTVHVLFLLLLHDLRCRFTAAGSVGVVGRRSCQHGVYTVLSHPDRDSVYQRHRCAARGEVPQQVRLWCGPGSWRFWGRPRSQSPGSHPHPLGPDRHESAIDNSKFGLHRPAVTVWLKASTNEAR